MPVDFLISPKEVRRQKFAYFLNPSELSPETQTWIIETIGSSTNGLAITKSDVMKDLETQNISAHGFVWNSETNWAFGCLQYYDWINKGTPQLWITDICRIGQKDPTSPSPIQNLFLLLKNIAKTQGISDVWLMVDNTESANKLQTVYEGYGFVREGYYEPLDVYVMRQTDI
jgi:hypothetical protein